MRPARPRELTGCTLYDVTTPNPTADQRRLLERHLDELDTWSRRLNLTSVPRADAWERHVGETMALLEAAQLATGARCADLGSGAGIPGIPVAVLRPDVHVTLIESDRRKAGFLVHVCGILGLANVRVVDRRAEDLARDPAHAARYDAVLSRAAAPPPLLWTLSRPLLTPGGTLWALVADADAAAAVTRLEGDDGVRARRAAPGVLALSRAGD
jgi:16S rRNA (guanine527-N7)-methyltransferase